MKLFFVMVKIENERRKWDGSYAGSSYISQVIGKFLSRKTLRLLSPGGSGEAGAGVSPVGKLCESLYPPLRRKLGSVPAVHKLLPAVKGKWFSSESLGLRSGQKTIGLQTNCSSLSQKQETTVSWPVGSGLGDRQCCSSPAALVFAAARWEQRLSLQVLHMQPSLLPQAVGMMIS